MTPMLRAVCRSRDETLPKSSEISGNVDKRSKTTYDCAGKNFKKGEDYTGVAAVTGGDLRGREQRGMLLVPRYVIFGDFQFNVPTRELLRVGNHGSATPISLGSRAADLLHLFLDRPGELITKNEIMDAVWPNMAVEESNLTVQISALRRALGGNGASYIQTVPGRGYRFTPRVNNAKGSGTVVLAGAAGALEADIAEPLPRRLCASPESIPPSLPQPVPAVSSEVSVGSVTTAALQPQQTNIWWLFLLQGVAGIILGSMLVTAPDATTVALFIFLSLYWLIMGILALVRVFVDRSFPWVWSLFVGIVGIQAGILVVRHPLPVALTVPTAIVIVLGMQGLIMGVLEIIGGFTGGGIGSFIPGVIYVLVGLFLLGLPIAAALAVPLVFGVLLLVQGVALIVLAFHVRA